RFAGLPGKDGEIALGRERIRTTGYQTEMMKIVKGPFYAAGWLAMLLGASFCVAQAQQPSATTQQAPGQAQDKAEKPGGMDQATTAAPVDPRTYLIGPEDVLLVRIWREPELSGPVAIRPDGKFSLPLIGEQQAGGLTPQQVAENLDKALQEFLKRPQVDVAVQEVRSKKYYVSGEVMTPGVFPLVVPTTVMQALTQAGGFREFANRKKVLILRGDERLTFSYLDYIKGKNVEENLFLKPSDQIIVQ
ncbi:MAG: polysaccharide biosynthesis/export family protein, partial [Betaproteobacteria bacterium]